MNFDPGSFVGDIIDGGTDDNTYNRGMPGAEIR